MLLGFILLKMTNFSVARAIIVNREVSMVDRVGYSHSPAKASRIKRLAYRIPKPLSIHLYAKNSL